jgi:WD40 repeat protein
MYWIANSFVVTMLEPSLHNVGKERATFTQLAGGVTALAFSADGKSLAAAGWEVEVGQKDKSQANVVRLWDVGAGKPGGVLKGHGDFQVEALAFMDGGNTLAAASPGEELTLWDVAACRERVTFSLRKERSSGEESPDDWITSMAFSPDGRLLAGMRSSSEANSSDVMVWDTENGREHATFRGPSVLEARVAFTADNRMLCSVSRNGTVTLWDVAPESRQNPFPGPPPSLYAAAVSADGKVLATAGVQGEKAVVQIWDIPARALRVTFRPPDSAVLSLALTPDGRTLAAGGVNGSLTIWDVAGAKQRIALAKQPFPILALALSADGQFLASASADREDEEQAKKKTDVNVWDLSSGMLRAGLKGHAGVVRSLAFTADGKLLAVGSGAWRLWGVPGGGEIKVWDVATVEARISVKAFETPVTAVAFAPDGQTLATGSLHPFAAAQQGDVRLWDAATGREIAVFAGHARGISCLAFTPDGKMLASGGAQSDDPTKTDSAPQELKLWDVATRGECASLGGQNAEVLYLAFTGDGKTLVSADVQLAPPDSKHVRGTVRFWDMCSPPERATLLAHPGPVQALSFTADGKTLAAGSIMETKFWDVVTGEQRRIFPHGQIVARPALTPDGKTLVAGSAEHDDQGRPLPGQLIAWDVATGKERLRVPANSGAISALALAPDGKTVAVGGLCWDDKLHSHVVPGEVKVYDLDTGEERFRCDGIVGQESGNVLGFSANGRLLAVDIDDKLGVAIDVWDVTTGRKRATLSGHRGEVWGVAFSPDSKLLASVGGVQNAETRSYTEGEIKLWDVATGKDRAGFDRQTHPVTAVAFAPDGKTFATGSTDGSVRLWDAATGKERLVYREHSDAVLALGFSPDGRTLASGSADRTVKLWDVPQP